MLDPNSIEVWDLEASQIVPHAVSEDCAYGDKARVEFMISDPTQTEYEIRFRVGEKRPAIKTQMLRPQIGIGDLLRYNAAEPRPVAVPDSSGLHDLNGDGLLDLTGTWNYAHRPGFPRDGAIVYPGTQTERSEFGDMVRLRHVSGNDKRLGFSVRLTWARTTRTSMVTVDSIWSQCSTVRKPPLFSSIQMSWKSQVFHSSRRRIPSR